MQIKQSSADVKRGGEIDEKAGFWNCHRGNVGIDGGGCNNSIDSLDITHHTIAEETSHERTGRLTATYNYYTYEMIRDGYFDSWWDASLEEFISGYVEPEYSWIIQTTSVIDDYAKVRWTTDHNGEIDSDTQDYELSFSVVTIPCKFDIHKTGSKYYIGSSTYQSISVSGSLESSFSVSGTVYAADSTSIPGSGYDDSYSNSMPYFTNIRFERY